jgi:carbon storage regulator
MLILTRKPGEKIVIGGNIFITVVEIKGNQIRVGIDAPTELKVYRLEIYEQIQAENLEAARSEGSIDKLAAVINPTSAQGSSLGKATGLGQLTTAKVGVPDTKGRSKK